MRGVFRKYVVNPVVSFDLFAVYHHVLEIKALGIVNNVGNLVIFYEYSLLIVFDNLFMKLDKGFDILLFGVGAVAVKSRYFLYVFGLRNILNVIVRDEGDGYYGNYGQPADSGELSESVEEDVPIVPSNTASLSEAAKEVDEYMEFLNLPDQTNL